MSDAKNHRYTVRRREAGSSSAWQLYDQAADAWLPVVYSTKLEGERSVDAMNQPKATRRILVQKV